jgi:AAA domain-containing protein
MPTAAADLERLHQTALRQPGAVRRQAGIKFQCPACAAEAHDKHRDNAILFNDGTWGCAVAKDTELGRAHWDAIGHALGALGENGNARQGATNTTITIEDGLGLVSLGELLGESDTGPSWVVDQRLPAAGLGLLAGKPKAGKSTVARCLALCVTRGIPWLGFPTLRGEVIYLALEEKRAEVRDHFRRLGATSDDGIHLRFAAVGSDALTRLRREADRRQPVLTIIDPLFKFVRLPAELGNDYTAMSATLEPLLSLARDTGAHVLAVHHLGKGDRGDGDAILGSTAIFAAVDTALLMKRSERYRTLSSIQRYGTDLEEITVCLDPATGDVAVGPPRDEVEAAEAADLILGYLINVNNPVTEAEIEAAIECRTKTQRRALRELVGTGKVVRTGRGGKGDPFRYSCSL